MGQSRFTPITSNLLARKGDAVPSTTSSDGNVSKFWTRADTHNPSPPPAESPQAALAPPAPPATAKPHKIMVTLTASEFEKLGIAAVKKGVTRHQVVRDALDLHLDRLKREYGGCSCMATGGGCTEGCGGI